jgi:hypothetical protein
MALNHMKVLETYLYTRRLLEKLHYNLGALDADATTFEARVQQITQVQRIRDQQATLLRLAIEELTQLRNEEIRRDNRLVYQIHIDLMQRALLHFPLTTHTHMEHRRLMIAYMDARQLLEGPAVNPRAPGFDFAAWEARVRRLDNLDARMRRAIASLTSLRNQATQRHDRIMYQVQIDFLRQAMEDAGYTFSAAA